MLPSYTIVLILIVSISILLFLSSFLIIGIAAGRILIYKKPIFDRQLLELKYRVYDRKWLERININIVNIKSKIDGVPLKLYICSNTKKINKTIIIFHHGVSADHTVGFKHAHYYLKKNFTFICFDSRGWGDNIENSYTTFGILETKDLLTITKYIKEKFSPKKIILHGESMGGRTVLGYASNYDQLGYVDAYIEDGGFASLKNIFIHNLKEIPYLPTWIPYPVSNWYVKRKTGISISNNNITNDLLAINSPILGIHSTADALVPDVEFETLKNNIQNFTYLLLQDTPHCLSSVMRRQEFLTKIDEFLNVQLKIPRLKKNG